MSLIKKRERKPRNQNRVQGGSMPNRYVVEEGPPMFRLTPDLCGGVDGDCEGRGNDVHNAVGYVEVLREIVSHCCVMGNRNGEGKGLLLS